MENKRLLLISLILIVVFLAACGGGETTAPEVSKPTEGPPPTAIPGDPETELGNPDGRDGFSTANNWTLFDNECFKSEIKDGQYVMTAKGIKTFSCWEVSWPKVSDYYLQTNIEMPEACNKDDRFGMFIRTPDLKQGYLVGLTCDGRLSMTKWDGESTEVLVNFVTSEHIKNGAGETNRLGVIANGSAYQLYVNGNLIAEVSDSSYTGDTKFGYFVRAAAEDGFTVSFDDMAIWLLDE